MIVQDATGVVLLVLIPMKVYVLADTWATLRFEAVAQPAALDGNNRISSVDIGVHCRPMILYLRLRREVIDTGTSGVRIRDDDVVGNYGTVEYNTRL